MAGGNVGLGLTTKLKGDIISFPVKASTRIYRGTKVALDFESYATICADTGGHKFVGIAEEEANNSSGADAAISIRVRRRGIFKMTPYSGAALAADVGKKAYASTAHAAATDEKVDLAEGVTHGVEIGTIVKSDTSANVWWVDVDTKPSAPTVLADRCRRRVDIIEYFDDFITGGHGNLAPLNSDDPETDGEGFKFGVIDNQNDWLVSSTNLDGGTILVDDGIPGGWLEITTGATEEDNISAQLIGTHFILAVGKPLYFESRLMIEDVSQTSWCVGLSIPNTDLMGSGVIGASDDSLMFYGIESTAINYCSSEDGSDTTADTVINAADATAATFATKSFKVAFQWDGVDALRIFVDGVLIDTLNTTDDDINHDEYMSPCFAIDTTAGGTAEKMWIDYIYCGQIRSI